MSLNHCTFSGNLTRDPELKQIASSGTSVCNFSLAVNRRHKAKGDSQAKQETAFINCELWDTGAEVFTKFFRKGDPVIIECEVKQDNWETEEGQKRQALKFRVSQFHFSAGYDYQKNLDSDGSSHEPEDDGVGFNSSADDDIPF